MKLRELFNHPAIHRFLPWFRRLYVTFHFLIVTAILLGSIALYVAFRPDGLSIVNRYVFSPLGIRYSHAEGSLVNGFTLYDVHTQKTSAKRVSLVYALGKILQGEHTIDAIQIDGLRLHLEDFRSSDSPWPFPTFLLKTIDITNLQLISAYPVEIDLHARNGSYDGDILELSSLQATIRSPYADAAVRGSVRNNTLRGEGILYPNAAALRPYSGRFTDLPSSLQVRIEALSDTQALLHTRLDRLVLKPDPSLSAESITLDFRYRYDEEAFDVEGNYLLKRGADTMQTRQHLRYALSGQTDSSFTGSIVSPRPLPSDRLSGEFTDSVRGLSGKLVLDGSTLEFASSDYDRLTWHLGSNHQNLSFIPTLPASLSASPLTLEASGEYRIETDELKGKMDASHTHFGFIGAFTTREGHHALEGNLTLPPDAALWKNWSRRPPEHMSLSLFHDVNTTRIHLGGEDLQLTGTLQNGAVSGSGNYLGAFFDYKGNVTPDRTDLQIETLIPSVFTTFSKLQPTTLHKGEFYDAELRAKTRLSYAKTLRVHSDVKIPWYAVVLDSQRAFGGTEGSFSLDIDDRNITVGRYRFEIADHPISTQNPSYLHLTPAGDLVIDRFWVYDTLLLNGQIHPDLSASLHLHSERFSYHGPEGDAHAAADLTFERDANASNALAGSITLLDGKITYLPLQQFKVMDDDIVIIQDVRPPSSTKLSMNVHITAKEPLHFQTKELNLLLIPDITLWRDPTGPMQILGMFSIPEGSAKTAGKTFEIKPSEIYFGGDVPLNPYLNLTILHEVDYKKILIYVTHTLDSPIFLFSSDPVMNQNDIMSYILFGTPANTTTTGDTSTSTIRADTTNFMLGAGLKGLISGVTKLQIDTMNILTTQEGGMGFEVGAHLNKDLRVLYKNDTVSSILVQYTINRWLRLDADVHELGQGIKAVYVKDFRDFLPHNTKK